MYVTAADMAEARRIGHTLAEERLAACVNVLPGHTAIYRWQGTVEEAEECASVAKSTGARLDAPRARSRALHSYSMPAVIALPAAEGDAEFLD